MARASSRVTARKSRSSVRSSRNAPSCWLSAIASLHTEAPDLEGRYRIAEEAVFEALERTGRPAAAELAGSAPRPGSNGTGPAAPRLAEEQVATSLGRDAYIHAVEVAKDAIGQIIDFQNEFLLQLDVQQRPFEPKPSRVPRAPLRSAQGA